MSTILFGGTYSLSDAPNPSPGSFLVAYDIDGIIKQKDSTGLVKPFYDFEGGGDRVLGTLSEVLAVGNESGSYSIVMGDDTQITSDGTFSYIILKDTSDNDSFKMGKSEGGLIRMDDINVDISAANSTDDIKISFFNQENTTTSSNKNNIILSSKNSTVSNGINNTVIIGGDSINATESNTIYIGGKLNIKNVYDFPIVDGLNEQVLTTDGSGNLYWGTQSSGGEVFYTGTSSIDVGGIEAGQYFEEKTMQEMWNALLNPELFPTLTSPSMTFTSTADSLEIIGSTETITFTATFNRGSVNPVYGGGTQYRSGLPSLYSYTGNLSDNLTDALSDTTQDEYTFIQGPQSWTCAITYDAGLTALSSYGNPFGTALPSGTLNKTITVNGVYPVFATSNNIDEFTQQPLSLMTNDIIVTMAAEPFVEGGDKQSILIPSAWSSIVGVMQFNDFSGEYEYIGNSAQNSLTFFDVTEITSYDYYNGQTTSYQQWTHNGDEVGARQLKFKT